VENRLERLEAIAAQIGEAVLATTETIERLADRVNALTIQVQQQGHQVQQQGYQIFALSETVQNLAQSQEETISKLSCLTDALQRFTEAIESVGSEE